MNILKRSSNTINIANFWENNLLEKYNFDPVYQRPSEVWSESKKSFLIDTILKNFPMPPIFLHQHIDDSSGKTVYDIIDGKQRLTSIIDFIENEISLPEDFSSDGFGNIELNGKYFKDLENPEYTDWKKIFWRYDITIEYIDTDQKLIVTNIFDRLNRNGEPLTNQELRNAKFNSTFLYKTIKDLSDSKVLKPLFDKLQKNRLEHQEFISELIFMQFKSQVLPGDNPTSIDDLFEKYITNEFNEEFFKKGIEDFNNIEDIYNSFNLDYEKHKIHGVSHVYGLWGLAWVIWKNGYNYKDINKRIDEFYELLRNDSKQNDIDEYRISMAAGTKSRARRIRRINSLLTFCNYAKI